MNETSVARCLLTVVVGLLLVGLVSHTPLRHVVQVVPGVVALVLARRRSALAPPAALAVFAFWLFIMTLIWLYLLGFADVVSGYFSPAEIALTVVVGFASLMGIVAVLRGRFAAGWPERLMAFALSACLQIAAMWLSLQPALATT